MSSTTFEERLEEGGFVILIADGSVAESGSYLSANVWRISSWDGETNEPSDRELLIKGTIKWDGCANLDIGEGGSYQLHLCGRRDSEIVGKAVKLLFDVGEKHLPRWCAETAA